jgi:hypothetical protein
MLEVLESASSVSDAAGVLASRYAQPEDVIERDMCELCSVLLERGLIEVEGGPAR